MIFKILTYFQLLLTAPYGIREKMEQIVAKEPKKSTVLSETSNHFPSTSSYSTKGMYDDLLIFSAKHLKLGGRLVCWFPVTVDDYTEKILPQHTALKLVANSEQKLTSNASRRLLTYEKVQDSGEIMNNVDLEELDFRMKYFGQNEVSRRDRGFERHLQNIIEAGKRGITIEANVSEKKKLSNKKRLLERNERNKRE
jgi:tRNA (guanine10-N2)-methyltransferase